MKRKKFDLKKEYKFCFDYLKNSKKFIYAIIWVFFASFLIGFFVQPPEEISKSIFDFIKELLEKTEGLSSFGLIKYIFFNNLKSSFMGMIFGSVLGIFSVISSLSNGYLVGFVSSIAVSENGFGSLLNLLPHGIFELPAIFISLGLGLKFGTFVFYENRLEKFREYFFSSIKVFFYVVLPLLIVAAIIEGTLISLSS